MGLSSVLWVDMPTFSANEGFLSVGQKEQPLPFELRRIYYLHGIPPEVRRGAHGHKELQQMIVAVNGSFKLLLDDGRERREFLMDDPKKAVYVPRAMWRELYDFAPQTVCLVMASLLYDEGDYIRDYQDFLNFVKTQE